MEYVGEEPPAPDYHANLHYVEPSFPVVYGCWAVASQPATDGNSVRELKADSQGPHERVYGRHAGVKHKRSEKGTIEVMDGLFDTQKELVNNVSYQRMLMFFVRVRNPYKETSHDPVTPWELCNTLLLRKSEHNVQKRKEARSFHCCPRPFTREVEARVTRGLALRVPVYEPLECRDLVKEDKSVSL